LGRLRDRAISAVFTRPATGQCPKPVEFSPHPHSLKLYGVVENVLTAKNIYKINTNLYFEAYHVCGTFVEVFALYIYW
jgi:hypothetical protein